MLKLKVVLTIFLAIAISGLDRQASQSEILTEELKLVQSSSSIVGKWYDNGFLGNNFRRYLDFQNNGQVFQDYANFDNNGNRTGGGRMTSGIYKIESNGNIKLLLANQYGSMVQYCSLIKSNEMQCYAVDGKSLGNLGNWLKSDR